jgi:cyclohexyl-isocyanide hydratase
MRSDHESKFNASDGTKIAKTSHLTIGCLVYPRQDQIDFTGPFEVLSRMPNSTVHVIGKEKSAFRDVKGLILTPDMTIAEAPQLDLLLVSGGLGQQVLMDDQEILSLSKNQYDSGRYVFSICTSVRRGGNSARLACYDSLGGLRFAPLLWRHPGQIARGHRR